MSNSITFNTVTNHNLSLDVLLPIYARHGVRSVSIWREKIDEIGVAEVARIIAGEGLDVLSICGWLKRDKNTITLDDKKRNLDITAELGAETMTLLAPGLPDVDNSVAAARASAFDHVAALLDHARSLGVHISLEPINPARGLGFSCLNTIRQAREWCGLLGPGIKVELDVHNIWWDPHLSDEIRLCAAEGLIGGVQLCDVSKSNEGERAALGEGRADLTGFVSDLRSVGYEGHVEVELIHPDLWARDPDSLILDTIRSCRTLLGDR